MRRRKKKEKKSNFVEDENSDFNIYKRGAFIGALLGGVGGLLLGKKIILGIVVGALAGGYINYQVHKDDSNTLNLKKFKRFKNNEDANN